MDNDLVTDLLLALAFFVAPLILLFVCLCCYCLFVCLSASEELTRSQEYSNTEAPAAPLAASMEDISQINTPMPTPGPVITESTENITGRNTRRNAAIHLPDGIILTPEIIYEEETHADPSNSSRNVRGENYPQSLSVSLPPEIILTPLQHVINPECDSPPSYESLFLKIKETSS